MYLLGVFFLLKSPMTRRVTFWEDFLACRRVSGAVPRFGEYRRQRLHNHSHFQEVGKQMRCMSCSPVHNICGRW